MVIKGDSHYDPSLPPLKYDPDKAKQLLKEANYKGEDLTLETPIGFMVMDKEMSEVVTSMWKDVGINAKLETLEYSVYQQKIREKSFKGQCWTDPTSAYNDPDGMMWRHLAQGGPNAPWMNCSRSFARVWSCSDCSWVWRAICAVSSSRARCCSSCFCWAVLMALM